MGEEPAAVNKHAMVSGLLVWSALFGVAVAVLGMTALVSSWQRRATQPPLDPLDPEPPWRLRTRKVSVQDFTQLLDGVDELSRQAVAAAAKARSAADEADAARLNSLSSQQAREIAWHDYDTAQHAYARVLRTGAGGPGGWPRPAAGQAWPVLLAHRPRIGPLTIDPFQLAPVLVAGGATASPPPPARPPLPRPRRPDPAPQPLAITATPSDVDDWRDVERAALAAYRRGDLSTEQLRAVYAKGSGGDADREQYEREVLRRRSAERDAYQRYAAAATEERRAYETADIAVIAAQALAEEAATATEEARRARVFAEECIRQAGGRRLLKATTAKQ
jgi:hypothetical protein